MYFFVQNHCVTSSFFEISYHFDMLLIICVWIFKFLTVFVEITMISSTYFNFCFEHVRVQVTKRKEEDMYTQIASKLHGKFEWSTNIWNTLYRLIKIVNMHDTLMEYYICN